MRPGLLFCISWSVFFASIASAGLTDGLVAYYPFHGDAKDASGHGYDGTVHGATLTKDHRNVDNCAYQFNGVDNYIHYGPVLPDMDTMTISLWVYSEEQAGGNPTQDSVMLCDGDWALGQDINLTTNSDNKIVLRADKNGSPFYWTISSSTPLHQTWRHLVWVMTDASYVYVDGKKIATISARGSNRGNHNFLLGTEEFPQGRFGLMHGYWKGKISALRIYSRALSDSEVQDLYNLESTSSGSGDGGTTGADILYVDDDAPGDPKAHDPSASDPKADGTREHPYDSIQKAIAAASNGQKVVVLGGTYRETIDFLGKNITVTGFDPNASPEDSLPGPVIDGNYQGTVVTFANGETAEAQLSGFTITRGKGRQAGGILCSASSPVISNCLIVGNRSQSLFGGGAIYCTDSDAVFDTCTISGNYGGQAGAGFYCSGGQAVMMNSILWNNTPAEIGYPLLGKATAPFLVYTDVSTDTSGAGNIKNDPLFVSPGRWVQANDPTVPLDPANANVVWVDGDYHLQNSSPCVDAGDPNYFSDPNQLDLDGRARVVNSRVDKGAYEYTSQPRPTGVTFIATCEDNSIVLTPDSTATNPEQTYVGEATIHLDAFFKLRLLAQATPASAAGGTWTVSLEPTVIGPGMGIEVKVSIRGEGVDISRITIQKGKVVLAKIELGRVLAP